MYVLGYGGFGFWHLLVNSTITSKSKSRTEGNRLIDEEFHFPKLTWDRP